MKVTNIYGSSELDDLLIGEKRISEIMDDFFAVFPATYRMNYDNNKMFLEGQRGDLLDGTMAEFIPGNDNTNNVIVFDKNEHLIHEFMHMAFYDQSTGLQAIEKTSGGYENAIIEGMAEYLAMMATSRNMADSYCFEVFCIQMLSTIPHIFKPFFIPDYDYFVKLFTDKRDIYSLIYSLNFYGDFVIEDKEMYPKMIRTIKDIIDVLIDIELSNPGRLDSNMYSDKFMDLISDDRLKCILCEYYPKYRDYANSQIKKRILRR